MAFRSEEEKAYVLTLLGECGELFSKNRRVVVAASDELGDGPDPCRALPVEVMVEALIESLFVFAGPEVDQRCGSMP